MRAQVLVLAVMVGGCLGSGPTEEGHATGPGTHHGGSTSSGTGVVTRELYTSGTRLKVQSLVGSDGSRQQAGLFDTQLQTSCAFLKTTGGFHCLPYPTTVAGGAAACISTSSSYFADAACTQPLCVVTAPGSVATHALNLADPAGATSHRVGSQVTGTVYIRSGGTCTETTTAETLRYFRMESALPLSDFVGATTEVEP